MFDHRLKILQFSNSSPAHFKRAWKVRFVAEFKTWLNSNFETQNHISSSLRIYKFLNSFDSKLGKILFLWSSNDQSVASSAFRLLLDEKCVFHDDTVGCPLCMIAIAPSCNAGKWSLTRSSGPELLVSVLPLLMYANFALPSGIGMWNTVIALSIALLLSLVMRYRWSGYWHLSANLSRQSADRLLHLGTIPHLESGSGETTKRFSINAVFIVNTTMYDSANVSESSSFPLKWAMLDEEIT